jgi:hypothetical protein
MRTSCPAAPARPVSLPTDVQLRNRRRPCWNCGCATSSTTRYWFDCVKMVEMRRWPKALYSALSMSATVTPTRAAASRSMFEVGLQAAVLRSLATSASLSGCARRRSTSFGTHSSRSSSLVGLHHEGILRAADPVLDGQILHRLQVQPDAGHLARSGAVVARCQARAHRARPAASGGSAGDRCSASDSAIHADERTDAVDIRVAQQHLGQRLLAFAIAAKDTVGSALRTCPGSARCPAPERNPWAPRGRAAR